MKPETTRCAPPGKERTTGSARRALSAIVALLVAFLGLIAVPQSATAAEIDGCSYGSGGENAEALCWIDFSAFGEDVTADDLEAGPVSRDIELTLGRYQVRMTATVSRGADGANGVTISGLPTWGGAVLGSTINEADYYVGTSGRPAFYQISASPAGELLERDTVELSGITVTDTVSGEKVTNGFAIVMADAESTGTGEGFLWKSDVALKKYATVIPSGGEPPCVQEFSGLGTPEVRCIAAPNASSGVRGIAMVSAESPSRVSSTFFNNGGTSREGVAFAVVFTTITSGVEVKQAGGSNANFTVSSSTPGQSVNEITGSGDRVTTGPDPILSNPEGTPVTYTVERQSGTPEEAYTTEWECNIAGTPVEPQLSDDGLSATITVPGGSSGSCVAIKTAVPPTAGDDAVTIKKDTVATLTPEITAGKGAITDIAFNNGDKKKVVEGEGTWTIELVDGQPLATFTPEPGYTGPVTQQPYTVTDEYGLSADGTLDVNIVYTGLAIEKDYRIVSDANGNGINDTGDIVQWTFTVTNTGNVALDDIVVDDPTLDDLGIAVICDPNTGLAPGAEATCESGTYTITDADVEAGVIYNVATAKGTVPDNTPGDPEDPTSPPDEVEIPTDPTPAPDMELVKSAHLNDRNGNNKADAGETIDYSFVVSNTGNTTLASVYVDDPMLSELGITVTCASTTLAPGADTKCAADAPYTVTAQDVKNGKVYNVATGHGTTPPGVPPLNPPSDDVEVPGGPTPPVPGLAITGGSVPTLVIGGGAALLLVGAALLAVRRIRRGSMV